MENMVAFMILTCGLFAVAGAIFAAHRVRRRQYERVSKRKKHSPKSVKPVVNEDEILLATIDVDSSSESEVLDHERSTETPSPLLQKTQRPSHLRHEIEP